MDTNPITSTTSAVITITIIHYYLSSLSASSAFSSSTLSVFSIYRHPIGLVDSYRNHIEPNRHPIGIPFGQISTLFYGRGVGVAQLINGGQQTWEVPKGKSRQPCFGQAFILLCINSCIGCVGAAILHVFHLKLLLTR